MHFPWCLSKCPYCDFVSYAKEPSSIDHAAYADAVLRELDGRARAFQGRAIASVFFGGGTPSLWDPRELGRVLDGIRRALPCTEDLEVTVECNPSSLDRPRADALAEVGVNRVSVGVQSIRAEQLKFLGRRHDAEGGLRAVRDALASSVPRVSCDFIFGLPEQSCEDAVEQARALAGLGLTHVSAYQLTIEPGTQFGELARRGRLPLADDGRVAEMFLAIDETFEAHGLRHYEISNFAAPGQEARHNLGYWRGEEYLGLGCAAYGFVRERSEGSHEAPTTRGGAHDPMRTPASGGYRYRNALDPARYVADPSKEHSRETLEAEALLRERIMLGLRLADGLDLDAAARDLGVVAWTPARAREAARLAERNRLRIEGTRLSMSRAAWLWADDTAARLF